VETDNEVVVLDHGTFEANVVPDIFDERDLQFRPRLQALPPELECRPADRFVLRQEGSSCTGHAVAAMINAVLAGQTRVPGQPAESDRPVREPVHVSPYMLYALARRYDEFEGEAESGSSLRGALKGWYYHGVLPDTAWPALDTSPEPDLLDPEVMAQAARQPLGAFYRVGTGRLDDVQSAVAELSAVVVSAAIHDGWNHPVPLVRTVDGVEQRLLVIDRTDASQSLGGHAFCIVGYNDVGFLVQNSWGTEWGKGGFATLPYDDWLDSGFDAWVARPGVPSVVSERSRRKILATAGGQLVDAPGPDLQRLGDHVVNLGNDGRLSRTGRFTSDHAQLDRIITAMAGSHRAWSGSGAPARVVLYAHGGLNSERTGLDVAQRQLNWWLRNEIYPVTFAWQTGLAETIENELRDQLGRQQPAGGWSVNLTEGVDRWVENRVRSRFRWIWAEMKENGEAATAGPLPAPDATQDLPGASMFLARLKVYLESQDPRPEVHLVGHSAGSIFLVGVAERLIEAGIDIASLTYLAGALRTDAWAARVLPHLSSGRVHRFTAFGLDPGAELDDSLPLGPVMAYHKSLLYLVSRGFEKPAPGRSEVPLVGMARFAGTDVEGGTYADGVAAAGGDLVWTGAGTSPDEQSESTTHGGFDDDSPTMTSVMLRIVGEEAVTARRKYAPHLPPPALAATVVTDPVAVDDQPPEAVTAEVQAPGQAPAAATAAAAAPAPAATAAAITTTTAVRPPDPTSTAPSRVMSALTRDGWAPAAPTDPEDPT
jgi:hypothetical protein